MSICKLTISGNLTADPELRNVSDASCACFTVAVRTKQKDADGNPITNFYRVNAWRSLGDNCAKYLHKGNKVTVCGDLCVKDYTGKNQEKLYSLNVTATDVEFPGRSETQPKAMVVDEPFPF